MQPHFNVNLKPHESIRGLRLESTQEARSKGVRKYNNVPYFMGPRTRRTASSDSRFLMVPIRILDPLGAPPEPWTRAPSRANNPPGKNRYCCSRNAVPRPCRCWPPARIRYERSNTKFSADPTLLWPCSGVRLGSFRGNGK